MLDGLWIVKSRISKCVANCENARGNPTFTKVGSFPRLSRLRESVIFASGLQGGNCYRIEAFNDEPYAQRKLKYSDRKSACPCQGAMLPDAAEHHREVASDEHRRAGASDKGKASGH